MFAGCQIGQLKELLADSIEVKGSNPSLYYLVVIIPRLVSLTRDGCLIVSVIVEVTNMKSSWLKIRSCSFLPRIQVADLDGLIGIMNQGRIL